MKTLIIILLFVSCEEKKEVPQIPIEVRDTVYIWNYGDFEGGGTKYIGGIGDPVSNRDKIYQGHFHIPGCGHDSLFIGCILTGKGHADSGRLFLKRYNFNYSDNKQNK